MTKSSFRTPLGRVRFLGPARQGAIASAHQRLTAVALAPLAIGFVWLVLSLLPKDYNAARAEIGPAADAIVVLLFVLVGVYHMQIGMRSVIIDYLGGRAQRMGAHCQRALSRRAGRRLRLRGAARQLRLIGFRKASKWRQTAPTAQARRRLTEGLSDRRSHL